MKYQVAYKRQNGGGAQVHIDAPDECTVCGRLIVFTYRNSSYTDKKKELQVVFQCNNKDCNSFLLLWYHVKDDGQNELIKIEPPNLGQENFSDHIPTISPDYVSIYQQAREAKERGLTQIAGPAYRKAFEFLIKDYAKSLTNDAQKHADIEKNFAGNVVNQFISDSRIQAVAKRALWLGNDETHYLRKWVQQDINDLINLIRLTLHWIDIEQESKLYIDKMPD